MEPWFSNKQKAILIFIYERLQEALKGPPKPEDLFYIPKGCRSRDIKEAIFPLSKKKGEAVEISKTLARLRKRGFINRDATDGYILTKEGQKIASEAYKRKEAIIGSLRQRFLWADALEEAKRRRRKEEKKKETHEKREARKHEIQSRFYSLQTGWKGLKKLGQEEKAREWLIKNAFKGYSVTKEENG